MWNNKTWECGQATKYWLLFFFQESKGPLYAGQFLA